MELRRKKPRSWYTRAKTQGRRRERVAGTKGSLLLGSLRSSPTLLSFLPPRSMHVPPSPLVPSAVFNFPSTTRSPTSLLPPRRLSLSHPLFPPRADFDQVTKRSEKKIPCAPPRTLSLPTFTQACTRLSISPSRTLSIYPSPFPRFFSCPRLEGGVDFVGPEGKVD